MIFNTKNNNHNNTRLVLLKRSDIHHSKLHTSCHRPIKRFIRSSTRASSQRTFTHPSQKRNIIWWAFVSTVIASIFGQLSNVALAKQDPLPSNDVLSKGVVESENDVNNIEDSDNTPYYDQDDEYYPDNTDGGDDSGEPICFYYGPNGDDFTCLPEITNQGNVEKRGNYLFRSRRVPRYIYRSRRAPSYLFRSKKAPSYLFRSRRSPSEIVRYRKAPGYLFRSRRAPGYLFRSKKAPSYLFRSKKAPGYLFRSRKAVGKQGRSYFFRSRKDPAGYLFRSRRGQGYLFRSRREEQTGDNMENEHDPSIATRAGYLFRTRKSYPNLMTDSDDGGDQSDDEENSPVDDAMNRISNFNPLYRQLRSRSYLFRTKKDGLNQENDMDDSSLKVATRGGAYLFRT